MTATNGVGATTLTTPADREIVTTHVVDAPRRLVFDALTSPEHLPYWVLGPDGWPMPVCEIDLRPGGLWRFVWRRFDGTEIGMHGVYQDVTPPERLVYTESRGDSRVETVGRLVFAEANDRTTITCTVCYPSKEARDAALRTGTNGGVSESLENLAEYVRTMT